MSFSAKKLDPTPDDPKPKMRLRQPSVDAVDPESSSGPSFIISGQELSVAPATDLPRRCVQCGDEMDVISVRTFRGKIGYSVCREHAVVVCGKLLAGLVLVALSIYCVGSFVLGDAFTGTGGTLFSLLLGAGGAALIFVALPVRTGKLLDGRHCLTKVHADVLAEMRQQSR